MTVEEKKVLETMESQMKEAGYQTQMMETDGVEELRVLLDELGNDGEGSVIMELCFFPIEDEEAPEDLRIFQIFTTIAGDIKQEKMPDILVKLNKTNLECVLGGYHIFEEEMQLYHRYVSVVRGDTSEQMLDIIQPALNWIVGTLLESYDELVSICS
jgi:hypothetical protein